MIGRELIHALAHHTVVAPSHADTDITDAAAVKRLIAKEKPGFIINAAAIIDMQAIKKDPVFAKRVNVQGAAAVAHAAAHHAIPQLLLSSSYVFSGSSQPFEEDAVRNPSNEYGKTKVEAEDVVAMCGNSAPYYIVRTSWIYSQYRVTFVDEVARALLESKPFEASAQRGNPTSGAEFAAAVVRYFIDSSPHSGVYHLVNEDSASRYDIACMIARTLRVPESLVVAREFSSSMLRPSVLLANTKLAKLRPWEESLHEYLVAHYG